MLSFATKSSIHAVDSSQYVLSFSRLEPLHSLCEHLFVPFSASRTFNFPWHTVLLRRLGLAKLNEIFLTIIDLPLLRWSRWVVVLNNTHSPWLWNRCPRTYWRVCISIKWLMFFFFVVLSHLVYFFYLPTHQAGFPSAPTPHPGFV